MDDARTTAGICFFVLCPSSQFWQVILQAKILLGPPRRALLLDPLTRVLAGRTKFGVRRLVALGTSRVFLPSVGATGKSPARPTGQSRGRPAGRPYGLAGPKSMVLVAALQISSQLVESSAFRRSDELKLELQTHHKSPRLRLDRDSAIIAPGSFAQNRSGTMTHRLGSLLTPGVPFVVDPTRARPPLHRIHGRACLQHPPLPVATNF